MFHTECDPNLILAEERERHRAHIKALAFKNRIASSTFLALTTRDAYIMMLMKDGSVVEGTVVIPPLTERVNSYSPPVLCQGSLMAVRLPEGRIFRLRVMDIDQAEVL